MRVGVVTFPGSCDDRDAAYALELLGMEPVQLWHADSDLHGVDAVLLPGGFSHGDYLRTGALARFAPVMAPIAEFAAIGGPVIGICNGFQILCEAGLLPGALTRNANLRFVARPAPIRMEKTGAVFTIPVKHGEGRYVHDDPEGLAANGQVLARYLDDPNGSVAAIAGVTNARGNVAGLMPHPEHAVDPLLGPTDGRPLLTALLHTAAA